MRLRLFEFPALLVVAFMAVVAPARADCDVPESGVTEDAVPVDFAGVRKSLAESGVAIGGYYAAETFGNPTGGFKQGATYDGVLELHLNADLNKLGLWKGLLHRCLSDPWPQHHRRLRPQLCHRKQYRGHSCNQAVRTLVAAKPFQ